jgi:quinoprotein glucose dehydrogenase
MWGGDRKGDTLFGNSLLALDARTGKRLWHFQTVHHDLWDYDLVTAPKLLTVRHEGKMVDIVAQATKFGLLYVFNRVTGEPLWPIEERPVPQSDAPGEKSAATQPFPTKPPPYARLTFTVDDINPYVDPKEKKRLTEILLNARNEGIFTPTSLTQDTITVPGELGGTNFGGVAADPETGMLYVRNADQPAMHILREWNPRSQRSGGNAAQRGRAAYSQHCEVCHGLPEAGSFKSMDRSAIISLREIGRERFAAVVRSGQAQMPGFSEDAISNDDLRDMAIYIMNPGAAEGEAAAAPAPERRPDPELPPMEEGMVRYTARLGAMLYADNGLSAMGPPWGELVAYDLNEGTIKWRAPLGTVPALAKLGIKNTGNNARLHRTGPAVTAGGLIFIGTWADRHVRAYDKDTGDILWEHELEANPASIPAVFETGGRQYVAFFGSSADTPREGNISFVAGLPDAQGYYVFALPEKAAATGN